MPLTPDTAVLTPTRITLPQVNEPLTPTLQFGPLALGFFASADDVLNVAVDGLNRFSFNSNRFSTVNGASLSASSPTATVPVLLPTFLDLGTGIGWDGPGQGILIADSVEVARFTEAAGVAQFIMPVQNLPATPSMAFGTGASGFYAQNDNEVLVSLGAAARYVFTAARFSTVNGASLLNEPPSATNPVLVPTSNDLGSGIGWPGANQLSLVAGSLDCINISEAGAARQIGFYVTAPIVLQTGVAVTAAGVHAALVALGLITA